MPRLPLHLPPLQRFSNVILHSLQIPPAERYHGRQIPVFEIKPNGFGGAKKQCRVSAADSLYFIDGLNGFLNLFLGCLVMLETGDPKLGTSVQKLSSISTNPSAEPAFSSLIIAGCSVIVSVMAEESVADDDDDMSSLELSGLFVGQKMGRDLAMEKKGDVWGIYPDDEYSTF
nr:hypothetical protein Iba_chr12bCG9580 [Ipomoea batatas]